MIEKSLWGIHYSDVIMNAMASQITRVSIVCLIVRSGTGQRKQQSSRPLAFCEGNSPVTGGFPSQRTSNAENVSIWWRLHDADSLGAVCPGPTGTVSTSSVIWARIRSTSFDRFSSNLALSRNKDHSNRANWSFLKSEKTNEMDTLKSYLPDKKGKYR